MKGFQVLLVFAALAAVAAASAPAPEPESHVCVPGKWEGKSLTVVQKKHLAILAKSAVDVDEDKAASAFVVFGGKHRHQHHDKSEFSLGRSDLTSVSETLEGDFVEAASNVGVDMDALANKKYHKGVTKIIADYSKEKLYIVYHKKGEEGNVTFCKVKDFEHPMSLKDALCLPERAKQGPSVTIGGSLLVDNYFFKAKNAYVQVALADEGNIPVSVNAVRKCGKGSININYFNITKDIEEGFFDIPSSCEGKAYANMLDEDEDFKNILKTLEGSDVFENPMAQLFAGADVRANEDVSAQTIVESFMEKVASFWRSAPASVNEAYDMATPKIAMFTDN